MSRADECRGDTRPDAFSFEARIDDLDLSAFAENTSLIIQRASDRIIEFHGLLLEVLAEWVYDTSLRIQLLHDELEWWLYLYRLCSEAKSACYAAIDAEYEAALIRCGLRPSRAEYGLWQGPSIVLVGDSEGRWTEIKNVSGLSFIPGREGPSDG